MDQLRRTRTHNRVLDRGGVPLIPILRSIDTKHDSEQRCGQRSGPRYVCSTDKVNNPKTSS